jgi:4-hydroxy-3-methylbut-2-enyl diphosphate reductase
MGPRRAAAFAEQRGAAGNRRRDAVVLGLAGALVDDLAPGAVVVADSVAGPGADRMAGGPVADAAAIALREAGIDVVRGPVRSVASAVRGAERRRLGAAGTLAADMESWWLLGAEEPPRALIRVICDTPTAELVSLSLPLRVRRGLAVLSRVAATLHSRGIASGPHSGQALERTVPGGTR